jgi:predicted nucleotide-binding protein (sugar kinase/HSP70/actin superfamily)
MYTLYVQDLFFDQRNVPLTLMAGVRYWNFPCSLYLVRLNMIEKMMALMGWIFSIWKKVPDSTKEKIIDIIVDSFDKSLRSFYKNNSQKDAT